MDLSDEPVLTVVAGQVDPACCGRIPRLTHNKSRECTPPPASYPPLGVNIKNQE